MSVLVGRIRESRTALFHLSQVRFRFRKGEYKLSDPHGQPPGVFRAGDRWNWLSVGYIAL
jgi:hypothetical protein